MKGSIKQGGSNILQTVLFYNALTSFDQKADNVYYNIW